MAITITLALAMGLSSLGTSIANIALPSISAAFEAPFAEVQAVVVAYLTGLTLSVLAAGSLGDRFGLKPTLMAGLALFLCASFLCAIAPNLWLLIGARLLQGIGAAFLMTLAMALMRNAADEARIGRAMGLLGTVSALGTALGPSLGGLLIPLTGWRGIFWPLLPLTCACFLLSGLFVPGDRRHVSMTGRSLCSAFNSSLVPSLLTNILVSAIMMTTLVVGPFYLSLGLGLSPTTVGFVMAIGPVISIFSGVPSGRLVDRLGARPVLTLGLILITIGAGFVALLPSIWGGLGYGLAILVLTPGYQLFQAANNTQALAEVPKESRGTTSGLLSLSRNIGLISGASGMAALFTLGAGTSKIVHAAPAAIASGLRLTFGLAAVLGLFAIAVSFGLKSKHLFSQD